MNRSLKVLLNFSEKGKVYTSPYSDLLIADLKQIEKLNLGYYRIKGSDIIWALFDYVSEIK